MREGELKKQLDWIKAARGKKRELRNMIVAWHNVTRSVDGLITGYNRLKTDDAGNPSDQVKSIHRKKMIIGALHEMGEALDRWSKEVKSLGLWDSQLEGLQKQYLSARTRVKEMKKIRNKVGFHFGDFWCNSKNLIKLYQEIDEASISDLTAYQKACYKFGFAMRKKVSKAGA